MKNIFSLLLLSALLFSCKKNDPAEPVITSDTPVKKPLGTPMGNEVTAVIGAAGGSLQSADGIMRITIPAGAVSTETNFSVQQVTNALGNGMPSYRLKPEGVHFQQPVKLEYYYGGTDIGNMNPKMLFLACQDKDGYYYSAKNTKGNTAALTLSVETKHFSDWTFYATFNMKIQDALLSNGKVHLKESESFTLYLDSYRPGKGPDDLEPLLVLHKEPIIQSARWDFISRTGTLTVNQLSGSALYKAPAQIGTTKELVVTAMLTGEIGKDNEGNPVRQMQFSQPVVLESDDYFILSEDGQENRALDFEADPAPGVLLQINGMFANGYNFSIYQYSGTTGSFPYQMPGTAASAHIEMVQAGQTGWRTFRPESCDQGSQLIFSPGSLVVTKLASRIGEYTEGHFTVTIWKFSYCQTGGTKSLSGRFKILKKV